MGLFDIFFKSNTAVTPESMPKDLKQLRKLRDKVKYGKENPYIRRICEVGLELYKEGKIIARPGDPNDVGALIQDIVQYIDDTHTYTYYTVDPLFELQLLQNGDVIVTDFMERKKRDPAVQFDYPADFELHVWKDLPRFYTEGKYCPRNTAEARKYLRLLLTYQTNGEKEIDTRFINELMEVIAPGEQGRQEILKWISIAYGLGALKIQEGRTYRNYRPQTVYQAAELLLKLDTDAIGGDDIGKMLDAYRRGVEANNAYAQFKLGQFYTEGRFVDKDEEKGLGLMKQAAAQGLSVAADAVHHFYYYKHCYDESLSKKQKKEYYDISSSWSKRVDEIEREVEEKYAPIIAGGFSDGVADISTRNTADEPACETFVQEDDSVERRDNESVFTCMDFPDTMTGPHGVIYRRQSIGINTADYWGEDGSSTTLHLSDLGATGTYARNSDGYFHW